MDGYEIASKLREIPSTRRARLVALTGYGQEEMQRRSEEAGFEASRLEWKPPREALEYAGLTGEESFPMFLGVRTD